MFAGEGQQTDNFLRFLLLGEGPVKTFLELDGLAEVLFKTIEFQGCW